MKRKYARFAVLGLLGMALLITAACAIGGDNTGQGDLAATQDSLSQTQIALSVQQTIQAQPATAPAPSAEATDNTPTIAPPTVEPAQNCNQVSFQGITFCYDPSLASDVSTSVASAENSEMTEAFSLPERSKFEFINYVLSPTFHTPTIQVIPIQAYGNISPSSMQVIQTLQTVLNNKPTDQESMPFLPQWNAAQMFVSKVGYVTFQNGQGVRYLTQYAQAAYPIANDTMFYTFQGITNDGQYFISAILPISHPSLPATGDAYTGSMDDLMNNFPDYLANIRTQLNGQSDDSFSPSILTLDAMMQSFNVQP